MYKKIHALHQSFFSVFCFQQLFYETKFEGRILSPVEIALQRYLLNDFNKGGIKTAVLNLLENKTQLKSAEEISLQFELSKIFQTDPTKPGKLLLTKPRTLKAFMNSEENEKNIACYCCLFRCSCKCGKNSPEVAEEQSK